MIKRDISKELLQSAKEYPVVTILGPRQSGKTTLAQMTFKDWPYFSLEDPDIRAAAEADPRGFLGQMKDGGILDEVQRLPALLSYIQGITDRSKARYILTGSHQPGLHEAISQSLAGRTAMLTLWPLSVHELKNHKLSVEPYDLICRGFYPRLHNDELEPRRFYNSYLQTYVERDLRSMINVRDLSQFQKFLTLIAGRIGQVVNLDSLSNDVGVSRTTLKTWLSVLKASFILFELPPFHENISKRLVKSSKIYFSDVGLAAYLLGIHSTVQASRDPLRGNLYENLIIADIVKGALNAGIRPEIYFYRDSKGNEIDLLIKEKGRLVPVEIKSAETFSENFLKPFDVFGRLSLKNAVSGFLLYNGDRKFNIRGTRIANPFSKKEIWPVLTGNEA